MNKYQKILLALAEGKQIEVLESRGHWVSVPPNRALYCMSAEVDPTLLRVAAQSMTIGGNTFNLPETVAPEKGTTIYVPDFMTSKLACSAKWGDTMSGNEWLKRGCVFLNADDAEAATRGFIQLLKGKT